ncbi:hypothetical protein [Hydrogenimonas sp.]
MSDKLARLKALADKAAAISTYETERKSNLKRLRTLYDKLEIGEKVPRFEDLFRFNAINVTGIGLTAENLGKETPKRYVQLIAIESVQDRGRKRSKNISLRYLGRVEQLPKEIKELIVEFILRWRFEKSFRGVDHYRKLLKSLETQNS